ncbi:MAG: YopX family protein [Candidatus Aminicenantales bacterium]
MTTPKFKAFDLSVRRWLNPDEFVIDPATGLARVVVYDEHGARLLGSSKFLVVVMATGRKEQSGRAIYESDIVIDKTFHGKTWVIEYRADTEYVGFLPVEIGTNHISQFVSWSNMEVVGNIYENGDLLDIPSGGTNDLLNDQGGLP